MCESRRRLNHALVETGERQTDSSFGGKFSLEPNFAIGARNSAEFSKPEILRPDREFESHLVRQLVSHVEGQASHRGGGVESLRHRDERDAMGGSNTSTILAKSNSERVRRSIL